MTTTKIKPEKTDSNLLHGKFELVDIAPGRYSVGDRIIVTTNLSEEDCNYLISIGWEYIKIAEEPKN